MKTVKGFAVILILLLSVGITYAQNHVRGTIIDKSTSQPIAFCNVMLYSDTTENGLLLGGGVSDEKGEYSIAYHKHAKLLLFLLLVTNLFLFL